MHGRDRLAEEHPCENDGRNRSYASDERRLVRTYALQAFGHEPQRQHGGEHRQDDREAVDLVRHSERCGPAHRDERAEHETRGGDRCVRGKAHGAELAHETRSRDEIRRVRDRAAEHEDAAQRDRREVAAVFHFGAEDDHDAAVRERERHELAPAHPHLEKQRGEREHERWIEIEDQPAEACRDVLQSREIEVAAEVIAHEPEADDAQPIAPGERRRHAGPPRHQQKKRQREQHAQREQRHGVHAVAVRELHDDGLAGESDRRR